MPTVLGVPDSAKKLGDTYTAGEVISALQVMRLNNSSDAFIADPTLAYTDAKVVGISLSAAVIGLDVDIQNFGILKDPFFNFPTNNPLFLSATGTITDTAPVTGYNVQIGHSLGVGSIFINVQEPILLP